MRLIARPRAVESTVDPFSYEYMEAFQVKQSILRIINYKSHIPKYACNRTECH